MHSTPVGVTVAKLLVFAPDRTFPLLPCDLGDDALSRLEVSLRGNKQSRY